jgi:4-carboxymuconolactone decarboxylase
VEEITQLAFYTGWPKAWSAFNRAKEVWGEPEEPGGETSGAE